MRHLSRRHTLLVSLAALASAVLTPGPAFAIGGLCGGAVPCACGDRVGTSRTLVQDVDPITTMVCEGLGPALVVFLHEGEGVSPLTLDLGGTTLRGAGDGVGIELNRSTLITVRNGRITGFRAGLEGTAVTDTLLTELQILDNRGAGIGVSPSERIVIEKCVISGNGFDGLNLVSDDSTVRLCRVEGNGGNGIAISGRDSTIARNIVNRNGFEVPEVFGTSGISVQGSGMVLDRNQAKYNAGEGLVVEGNGHTVTLNVSSSNGTDGFRVSARDSRFERNTASYNGRPESGQPADGYGIHDTTTGDGTGETDNTYFANRCTGNGLGASSPSGLCF